MATHSKFKNLHCHETGIKFRLEAEFCDAMRLIAKSTNRTISSLLKEFDGKLEEDRDGTKASHLRRYILRFFVDRARS